jgi:hypothetical protein
MVEAVAPVLEMQQEMEFQVVLVLEREELVELQEAQEIRHLFHHHKEITVVLVLQLRDHLEAVVGLLQPAVRA